MKIQLVQVNRRLTDSFFKLENPNFHLIGLAVLALIIKNTVSRRSVNIPEELCALEDLFMQHKQMVFQESLTFINYSDSTNCSGNRTWEVNAMRIHTHKDRGRLRPGGDPYQNAPYENEVLYWALFTLSFLGHPKSR